MQTKNYKTLETDILVVGGGIAGCYAALRAKRASGRRVMLVDKAVPGKSGTSTFAAGVIAIFFPQKDNLDQWMRQLVELGDGLNDQKWLQIVLESEAALVEEMASWGTEFVRTKDGDYERIMGRGGRPEGGLRNIMFHGPQFMEPVAEQVRRADINVVTRTAVFDLLMNKGRVMGGLGMDVRTGEVVVIKAPVTILSTGGTYSKGTFVAHKNLSGDAHAICLRAGADLMCFDYTSRNLSWTEFDSEGMNMFQGLGGKFVNSEGDNFLPEYDPTFKDLTTKPRMDAAFTLEVDAGRGPILFDMTHFGREQVNKIREALPLATMILERAGALAGDRIVRKLPWGPAGPGSIAFGGGARIDTECRSTNLEGLYVAGDSAARLAAGSHEMGGGALTWAMVSGARAGEHASRDPLGDSKGEIDWAWVDERSSEMLAPMNRTTGIDPEHVILSIQETLFPYNVLEIRHEKRLRAALDKIKDIQVNLVPTVYAADPHQLLLANEARSLSICAELFVRSGMERKESRCNLREDFKMRDNIDWLKWICCRWNGEKMDYWTVDIPPGPVAIPRERAINPLWAVAERRNAEKKSLGKIEA